MLINKKGQAALVMGLVFGVILLIIGVTIANNLNTSAQTETAATQSIVYTNASNTQSFTLTPIEQGLTTASFRLYNATFNVTSANYTVTTAGDLTVYANGNNTFTASWTYQHFGYVSGTTRTIILFIPLFIALAALAIAAAFVSKRI